MYATLEEVHIQVVRDACDIANRESWILETFGGPIFVPGHDQRRSFVITWDESISHSPPEIIERLHRTGKAALNQAIRSNGKLLGGLIAGMAKKNKDYFEVFER